MGKQQSHQSLGEDPRSNWNIIRVLDQTCGSKLVAVNGMAYHSRLENWAIMALVVGFSGILKATHSWCQTHTNHLSSFVLEYLKSSHELAERTGPSNCFHWKTWLDNEGVPMRGSNVDATRICEQDHQDRRWVFQAFEVSRYGRVYWLYLCSLLYGMYAIVWDLLSADGPLRPHLQGWSGSNAPNWLIFWVDITNLRYHETTCPWSISKHDGTHTHTIHTWPTKLRLSQSIGTPKNCTSSSNAMPCTLCRKPTRYQASSGVIFVHGVFEHSFKCCKLEHSPKLLYINRSKKRSSTKTASDDIRCGCYWFQPKLAVGAHSPRSKTYRNRDVGSWYVRLIIDLGVGIFI